MADKLLAAPLAEPVHLTEAKAHLRVTTSDEDAFIASLIVTARQHVETYCRHALVRQQRLLTLDCFPQMIEMPVSPLRAVQSIQYLDTAGALQTLASSQYRVDAASEPARITPAYGVTWPSTYPVISAVTVKYTVGHVVPIGSVDAAADTITAKGHDLAADAIVQLSNSGGALPGGLSSAENYYAKSPATDSLQLASSAGGAAVDITSATGSGQSCVGAVPAPMRHAMLLIIGHLFEHREEVSDIELFEMPFAAAALLSPYRVVRF